jgi:uncharacterized protein (DUF1499 family)
LTGRRPRSTVVVEGGRFVSLGIPPPPSRDDGTTSERDGRPAGSASPPRRRRTVAWIVGLGVALAVLAALTVGVAGLGYRVHWWSLGTGFALFRWGARIGPVATVICLVGVVVAALGRSWRTAGVALAGALLGLVALGVPWSMQQQGQRVPPIHDITTDLDNPPRFVAILPLRQGASNPAEYGGPAVAARQREGYPDLGPATFVEPPARVFPAVEAAARQLGWRIVAAVPAEGRFEASDTTAWFGFTDDVVVRVSPRNGGSRVDVRSVSRLGRSDLGANAARIRRFLAKLGAFGLTSTRAG